MNGSPKPSHDPNTFRAKIIGLAPIKRYGVSYFTDFDPHERDIMTPEEKPFGKEWKDSVERLRAEPIPEPAGGGTWKNDFDFVEFDYSKINYIELDENIHSHEYFSQEKGWLYHFCRDRAGHKYVQFMKPDPDGFHCQTILYRLDWMQNAKFVRAKPTEVTKDLSKVASPCPNLI